MEIIVTDTYEQLSTCAAKLIAQKIVEKPNAVLGLATGSTPVGVYKNLVDWYRQGKIDFAHVTTFNLDEYVGLPPGHEQSYCFFMQKHLFGHVNITPERRFIPNGLAQDFVQACDDYENSIKRFGGIDLQILGIGRDGHIGFNEPGSLRDSRTRAVDLAPITVQDNARFFENNLNVVPTQAITMGVATILEAHTCVLLANGAHKADILARALCGPIDETVPASFLQQHHNLIVIVDKEASRELVR